MKPYFLLPLAALAILGAGCLGQTGTPAQPSPAAPTAEETAATEPSAQTEQPVFTVDPCVLLTADDAKQILGGPVNPAFTEAGDPSWKICRYTTTRESNLSRMIELRVDEEANIRARTELSAAEFFKRNKTVSFTVTPDQTEELPGYGDEAYWSIKTAHVLKNGYVLDLWVGGGTNEQEREDALAAMKIVLGRLK